MNRDIIKKNFYITNYITLAAMYFNKYKKYDEYDINDLKTYNPGHLGSSLNINFLLTNLNYFINKNNLKSKIIIGTGHSGISLLSNLYLNGTLSDYYKEYSTNKDGLNNFINDFGVKIRSEINPTYPGIIYNGGELGYSLSNAYGYAIDTDCDIVPCIIGDGEAETGTLSASWYLNRILKTKAKVLPIINLNNYKMGSNSYLSRLNDEELNNYFLSLGYNVEIIDTNQYDLLEDLIGKTQDVLDWSLEVDNPLLIIRMPKAFTLPVFNNIKIENNVISHKNPLSTYNDEEKILILKHFLEKYYVEIFKDNKLDDNYIKYFKNKHEDLTKSVNLPKNITFNEEVNIKYVEKYLEEFLKINNCLLFSPDEIYSNQLGNIKDNVFELLNENVLEGLMEGYIEAGNNSLYIAYEGFMPIINSMIAQRYKYLLEKSKTGFNNEKNSLNYILTSICWENTYSHQNPSFVNDLLMKDDRFYNILYPKDGNNFIKCLQESFSSKDKINIITMSKRQKEQYNKYEECNTRIDIIEDIKEPDIVLCATGDYMLSHLKKLSKKLLKENPSLKLKIIYITNPKILDINSKCALTEYEFNYYFNSNNVIYLFNGYSHIIKSLLYDRNVDFKILGFNDSISTFGGIDENLNNNGLSLEHLSNICYDIINNNKKVLKLRR